MVRQTLVVLVTVLVGVGMPGGGTQLDVGGPGAAPEGTDQAVPPVPGPVERPFDPPDNPYGPGHRGVDLAAEPGEEVRAALAGQVHFSGVVAGAGWVSIDHGGGLRTTYGDLDPRSVSTGAQVQAGTVIGEIAEEASHLDWGALVDEVYIDPMALLGDWEIRLVAPLD